MLQHQFKEFVAAMKRGVPPAEALAGLDVSDEVKARIAGIFAQAASSGVSQAQDALQSAEQVSITADWQLINENAVSWARNYAYSQIKSITETSKRVLQERVSAWMTSGKPLADLIRDPTLVAMFGPVRAKMIAVTEVTRAYAEANQQVFQQTGVPRRRWNTAHDELVCPVCGPLNQVVVDITEPFPGGLALPPAHPNCRCWITPVVGE
ncbi:MAG: phage head morphogenesis protein [Anaerolineae bacterium]